MDKSTEFRTLTVTAAREVQRNGLKNCVRCWAFDGAGSAQFGWYYQHPAKQEYLGKTRVEAERNATLTLAERPTAPQCSSAGLELFGDLKKTRAS